MQKPKQHIHHKEIKAWADGRAIQWMYALDMWVDTPNPSWLGNEKYRIKPPEPEWMPKDGDWILVRNGTCGVLIIDRFIKCTPSSPYSYICVNKSWSLAEPFPLQVERDRYRAALENIAYGNRCLSLPIARNALENTNV